MRNFSTALKLKAKALRTGVKRARQAKEIMPPIKLERIPIFRARSLSPRFAIGKPSKVVVIEDGVPGILIKIAGTRPPEIPPT